MKVTTKPIILFLLGLVLALTLAVNYAPSLLILSEAPVKSDAVVVFVGGEKGTRMREADQLIGEGFADYLIIPAYGRVKKLSSTGKLERVDQTFSPDISKVKQTTASWLEDTHREAIMARGIMERLGLKSAILVSSPYHMRRIKLIAGKVFEDKWALYYVPTRYETRGEDFWLFNSRQWKYMLTEYTKITWFSVYSPFV